MAGSLRFIVRHALTLAFSLQLHSREPTNRRAAVEYRLLHQGPFPSAVQDAAAVYYHIVKKYGERHGAIKAFSLILDLGKCHARGMPKGCRIILIGDSSGGNLVLATARWLRDENLLPPPDGLLLLSVRLHNHPNYT
jgi:acetyl esterase/lipase